MAEHSDRIACNPLQPSFPQSLIGDISFSPTHFREGNPRDRLDFGDILLIRGSLFRCTAWLGKRISFSDYFRSVSALRNCCCAALILRPWINIDGFAMGIPPIYDRPGPGLSVGWSGRSAASHVRSREGCRGGARRAPTASAGDWRVQILIFVPERRLFRASKCRRGDCRQGATIISRRASGNTISGRKPSNFDPIFLGRDSTVRQAHPRNCRAACCCILPNC